MSRVLAKIFLRNFSKGTMGNKKNPLFPFGAFAEE
jgi:hypothetical protein